MRSGELWLNGLWRNNPAVVQLLGLCPLLGVSNSMVNALGLGIVTIAVLGSSNCLVSVVRNYVPDTVRLPIFVMIIAALTTCAELLMQAYAYPLYTILGIFIPIIVTNCIILARAEAFARRNAVLPATIDGLAMGAGFASALLVVGAMRELIGTGGLFANMELLFGQAARNWQISFATDYPQVLVAILPPGAFLAAGCLIALYRIIDTTLQERATARAAPVKAGAKRVRITGIVR